MKKERYRALLLFDIDGTLLRGGHSVHGRSIEYALFHYTQKKLDFLSLDYAGRTDSGILLALLSSLGYEEKEARELMGPIFDMMVHHHHEHEKVIEHAVLPGVFELLGILQPRSDVILGLLTGNHEKIAWHKLFMAGLADYFEMGAFGNEAVERPDLVPLASARACERFGAHLSPRSVVIIGDTPRDIACGRAHGATTISVATGPFTRETLSPCSPDLLLSDLSDGAPILELISSLPL